MNLVSRFARRLANAARLVRLVGPRETAVRAVRMARRKAADLGSGLRARVRANAADRGAAVVDPRALDGLFRQGQASWADYLRGLDLPPCRPIREVADGTMVFVDLRACAEDPAWLEGAVTQGPDDAVLLFADVDDEASPLLPGLCEALARGDREVLTFDSWRGVGEQVEPFFAPGANVLALEAVDYLFSRFAMRRSAARRVLEAARAEGLTPYGLLRAWLAEANPVDARWRWRHDARPLARLAVDEAVITRTAEDARRRADAALARRSRAAPGSVSVVICSKDKGWLLNQIVRAVRRTGGDRIAEVVVVANNTTDPHAREVHRRLAAEGLATVIAHDAPFNFSRLSNLGAASCRSPFLLLLNDDVVLLSDDWLEPLLAPFDDPTVGVAGPLLLYPDGRVQHAGMYLGYGGIAGHVLRCGNPIGDDYHFMISSPREVSAVTGAVMMVRTEIYRDLGGLDEGLASYLQDVDFCLRAGRMGHRIAYTPHAPLLHLESISVGEDLARPWVRTQRAREHALFIQRWGSLTVHDPFHSPNFDAGAESLRKLAAG